MSQRLLIEFWSSATVGSMGPAEEKDWRAAQLNALITKCGSTVGVPAAAVNELRIFYGGRGIWYDAARTQSVAAPGVTVGVLHTGKVYDDDLAEDCIIYHYPRTKSPGKDANEVQATKNAGELGIPIFVVVSEGAVRHVHEAWVVEWDDESEQFLFEFGSAPKLTNLHTEPEDSSPFEPVGKKKTWKTTATKSRPGQQQFAFAVLKRYGAGCAACGLNVKGMVDAAHVVPDHKHGVDDARNGLPLCPTHHRAFDSGYLLMDPATHSFVAAPTGPSLAELGVTKSNLLWLPALPHPLALEWHWQQHNGSATA